jgi:FkbM family methyltransferase
MSEIDPGLFNLLKEFVHKDNVVWDVGANVGLFAFGAAHLSGPNGLVVALEPDAWLVQLLRRSSLNLSPLSSPVYIIPAAAARSVDLRTFNLAARSRATSFLDGYGSTQSGGVAEKYTVITLSLDWLSERYPLPDILKIDVEGAELEVLKGATGLLDKKRPTLLCEVSAETSDEVTALLSSKGYLLYNGDLAREDRKQLISASWNTIALPT